MFDGARVRCLEIAGQQREYVVICWIERVSGVDLRLVRRRWSYAEAHSAAIHAHWSLRSRENPSFFNGRILVQQTLERGAGSVGAQFSAEAFASFLHWRERAPLTDPAFDGFASALVRTADGHILLARNAGGTLNSGVMTLPGGFFDERDVMPDGAIDVGGATARELEEETGIHAASLFRTPGYVVMRHGRLVSFTVEYRSLLGSDDFLREANVDLAQRGDGEVTQLTTVSETADLARGGIAEHTRFLLAHILSAES